MGLYTITTRASGTVLTGGGSSSDIFNNDHLNHVTHTAANFINSYEDTLPHMQATTDPAPAGVVSLPAALSDEIQRIRFAIAQIKQKISGALTPPFWYDPTAAFSAFVTFPPTAARLEQTTTQSIPDGTTTDLTFQSTIYDTSSMHIQNGLAAPVSGVYIVGAFVAFTSLSANCKLSINRDDFTTLTRVVIASNQIFSGVTAEGKALTVESAYFFTKNQRLSASVTQTSGSPQSTVVASTVHPAMWMALVGRL